MDKLEKYGSTFLGRLLDKKAKERKLEKEMDKIADETCTCSPGYQVIGCSAYKHKTCIWHPDNDPYDLKNREWVRGQGFGES